jgi:hypothetical protein
MKLTLKEMCEKLGVERAMTAYDTQPWLVYDAEKGVTCMAEVRCNHDQTEIEAELQMMHDKPEPHQKAVEQMAFIHVEQQKRLSGHYTVTSCHIKGEDRKGSLYDWETKSCNFFRMCVKELKNDKIPDIDKLIKQEMRDSGKYGSGQGDGSNKSPKINASQLMYDRKGIGAGF